MTILYPHVLPFGVISNGRFTPLHTNLPGLEAAPEATLNLLWYHGVYVTSVLFDSHFF
jgi:hypothetical protein